MSQQSNEILITIMAGTAVILLFAFTLIFLVVVYRKKQREYHSQKAQLKENFKKELLTVQLETQEQTFHTLSQELHDNIGQVLSLAKLNITLIGQSQDEITNEYISQTKDLLHVAITDLRNISKTLNQDYVKNRDLEESIKRELEMLKKSRKFETSFAAHGSFFVIQPERTLILFRMVQESLNNIVQHAEATAIKVNMLYQSDALQINIIDNGNGFDLKNTAKGVGMLNMEHRAKLIRSTVMVESLHQFGTTVQINVAKWGPETV